MASGPELERHFHNPPDLSAVVQEAEAGVARWVWTRRWSDRWHEEPLWALRNRLPPGRDYKREPKTRHDVERYGYDSAGRLQFAERFEFDEVDRRLIVQRNGGLSLRWELDSAGSLQSLHTSVVGPDIARPASSRRRSRIGSEEFDIAQSFEYDDAGRLTSVRFEGHGADYDRSPATSKGQQRISYGSDGQPVSVVVFYDDPSVEPETVYKRVGETWSELAESVREPLVQAIAAAVTSSADELAMVALYYPSADLAAPPPVVYACSTARRAELIEEWGYDRVVLLPPEWREDELELELPAAAAEPCLKLKTLVDQGRAPRRGPHELMLSLASALGSYAWPPSLYRPDDFAVYAVDAEGEDLERNIVASVPQHQVARWRELGLLGRAS